MKLFCLVTCELELCGKLIHAVALTDYICVGGLNSKTQQFMSFGFSKIETSVKVTLTFHSLSSKPAVATSFTTHDPGQRISFLPFV